MKETKDDPFEGLLELENTFYNEGYDLGVVDGKQAGLVEGRLFGLEKGFEKYAGMGRLNGKAVIWAGRLPPVDARDEVYDDRKEDKVKDEPATGQKEFREPRQRPSLSQAESTSHAIVVPALADNARLEKHIRTLYALVEPGSLSTDNTEEAVSDFDDRLKRAAGKVKIIEKITGETSREEASNMTMTSVEGTALRSRQTKSGGGSIEDVSSLHARHER